MRRGVSFQKHYSHEMCRWLAYSGSPVLVEELLYDRQNSLIVQSLHSRLGAEETNGDGFGIGWYGEQESPAVFHSIEPAWNDRNLRELAGHITSPLVFAHIRASTGSPVQQTNCHPFRHGRWLWMHNGFIDGFTKVKRDLTLAVDPELFPEIEGTTDSELMFYLALTFGLEEDPPKAVARTIGLVESVGRRARRRVPVPGDDRDHGRRAASGRSATRARAKSRSLYFSTDVADAARALSGRSAARSGRRRVAARWSRSRWATYRARGTRCPSLPTG